MAYEYPLGKFGSKFEFWITEDGLQLLMDWRRNGCTMKEIAENIGISYDTLFQWVKKYGVIANALKLSKEVADSNVENALYKRTQGFVYDEITEELVEGRMMVTKKVTKIKEPDVTACLAWLYSRRSKTWRRFQEDVNTSEKSILAASQVLVNIRKSVDAPRVAINGSNPPNTPIITSDATETKEDISE